MYLIKRIAKLGPIELSVMSIAIQVMYLAFLVIVLAFYDYF
jgi:hypothetical protein